MIFHILINHILTSGTPACADLPEVASSWRSSINPVSIPGSVSLNAGLPRPAVVHCKVHYATAEGQPTSIHLAGSTDGWVKKKSGLSYKLLDSATGTAQKERAPLALFGIDTSRLCQIWRPPAKYGIIKLLFTGLNTVQRILVW